MDRPVSMADVARHAGASASAVSRVLNGRRGVRPEIRQAVLHAADELGYVPNRTARNLALRRTGLIALIIGDQDVIVGSSLFSEVIANVVTGLDAADCCTVLLLPDDPRRRSLGSLVRRERFDGAILVGHRAGDPLLRQLATSRLPLVTLGRSLDMPDVSSVDVDNISGAREATSHLLSLGRRCIGLLAGPSDTAWGVDRRTGYQQALRDAGHQVDESLVEECAFTRPAGLDRAAALLQRRPDIDGLLIASEAHLFGALAALHARGSRIPDDVAVVTFDDGPAQRFGATPISAVQQPLAHLGQALAQLLLANLEPGAPVQHRQLGMTLAIRQSSAGPAVPPATTGT